MQSFTLPVLPCGLSVGVLAKTCASPADVQGFLGCFVGGFRRLDTSLGQINVSQMDYFLNLWAAASFLSGDGQNW